MRAYELMKETFFRRTYIPIAHVVWLTLYALFWWVFVPGEAAMGRVVLIWGGFLLPLVLSAGIFGDDIASGRICVLIAKPFWPGELYVYRLLGQSLQAALHFLLAGGILLALHAVTHKGSVGTLGWWLLASWLLFNTVAALSTSLSVVVGRAFNSLLLLVVLVTGYLAANIVAEVLSQQGSRGALMSFVQYAWPPFDLLAKLGGGEYGKYSLTVGRFSVAGSTACVIHSLVLTAFYSAAGILILNRREFSRVRD